MRRIKRIKPSFWIFLLTLSVIWSFAGTGTAYAGDFSLEQFKKIAIMEEGRVKPLDTYAQNILKQFSGRSRFERRPAIEWLARVLLAPETSYDDKIFLITNLEVLDSIGVQPEGKARERYSYSQLRQGLTKLRQLAMNAAKIDDKQRAFIENEILALYNKLYVYQQLLASFDFILAHPDFTITNADTLEFLQLPKNRKQFGYIDLAEKSDKMREVAASVKDKAAEEQTAVEKEVVELYRRLEQWARFYGELPLTVIPPAGNVKMGEKTREKWFSPWSLASAVITMGTPVSKELLLMRDFIWAYQENSQVSFDKAVMAFNDLIRSKSGGRIRPGAISAEVIYNKVDPFYKTKFFYGFAVLFLLLSYVILPKWFYRLSFALLLLGFLLHLYGVIARMIIMARPPVTNLYETFVFTGLITALLGMVLEFFKKKNLGVLTGALAGFVMLMIAGKYALEGDTMGMLVAVLDSNFWLASHVITIILGYSGVVLSGFIGHVYIIQKIARPDKETMLKNTFQAIYAIQAFGIIFTFLGTVLGGIWADQSWGRFWGWDPKENGALVILLWSAILFHARRTNWIKETGMAFGSVIGVIAVSLAWFGVNLLGVGLHSYGFTSGVAKSLFLFITFEVLFMVVTGMMLMTGRKVPEAGSG